MFVSAFPAENDSHLRYLDVQVTQFVQQVSYYLGQRKANKE